MRLKPEAHHPSPASAKFEYAFLLSPLVINLRTGTNLTFGSRVSKLSIVKGPIRYWGLVRGPHVEKILSDVHYFFLNRIHPVVLYQYNIIIVRL